MDDQSSPEGHPDPRDDATREGPDPDARRIVDALPDLSFWTNPSRTHALWFVNIPRMLASVLRTLRDTPELARALNFQPDLGALGALNYVPLVPCFPSFQSGHGDEGHPSLNLPAGREQYAHVSGLFAETADGGWHRVMLGTRFSLGTLFDVDREDNPWQLFKTIVQAHMRLPEYIPQIPAWRRDLDERTRRHIDFAESYATRYNHGTDGHLSLITINRLAKALDLLEGTQEDLRDEQADLEARLNWLRQSVAAGRVAPTDKDCA